MSCNYIAMQLEEVNVTNMIGGTEMRMRRFGMEQKSGKGSRMITERRKGRRKREVAIDLLLNLNTRRK
ncbi:hypothetical protein VNO77_29455 [Canavalia gladiata]|uniref:Uncharacterized protein n=1 Tax=Canavalia gladiata TaxID=3824 RepID=A0AAN9Q5C5_CANGL